MKFQLKNIVIIVALALVFTSCSKDDDPILDTAPTGKGSLKLEFDNVYGDANFAFGTEYTNSNGEKIKPNKLVYIISNIVLTNENGSSYTVPKSESYFFVNESNAASTIITIPNVPAANYTKVKFGIGVDKAQFDAGASGQGTLWETASSPSLGMTWSWAAGYKFVKFEGTVTSATQTNAIFRVHTGKTGDVYNYAEATLTFPSKAIVRTTISPQVHILAHLKTLIDGSTKINFEEGLDVMGGVKVQNIMANNVPNMFAVDHVHND